MISDIRDKINNAIFMFKISKKVCPNRLIVNNKMYENIKSYIGLVKKDDEFKEYFCGLEVIIDNSIQDFKLDCQN
jgi:hypothetical protein